MENALHQRIRQRLTELNLSDEAASLRMGADRSYFRKLFSRPDSSPRGKTLNRIAEALETSEAWLLSKDPTSTSGLGPLAESEGGVFMPAGAMAPTLPARQAMPLDVPVMGTAAGSLSRGAFQFEGGVVDYVRRPPALVGAKDIYALYVEGESMVPQYHPGELIYLHPHRPVRVGDAVVVQSRNGEHSPSEASLGIYRRRTEKAVVIGKHNPVAEIEFNRTHVTVIHRVLTTNELFGV